MADDPGHKAMLYFLEILMYSNTPMTISQLAGRFGSRNFTQDMRTSAGGNEAGLRKFLLKYPSLFTVNGNLVSLNDGTAAPAGGGVGAGSTGGGGGTFREGSPASSTGLMANHSSPASADVSTETEAVQYFRAKLLRKGEKWMLVRSLAGHLSQASPNIRECVGPQNEFHAWLCRHPLIFDVKEEMVCLKDNIRSNAADPSCDDDDLPPLTTERPLSYPNLAHTPKLKRRPKSLEVPSASSRPTLSQAKVAAAVSASGKPGPITMTANEYKAVMFIKSVIDKKGDMKVNSLSGHFSQAPESLRNTIGWSKPELERFIAGHSNIFLIAEDETVSVIKNTRLNVIITGSRPAQAQNKPTVTNRSGKIFHIAKLWGIIDLGKHEHVFIDRTIFGKNIDDLNKLLKMGDSVCFDAIPAPKGSRARWRATKVWKEDESIEDLIEKVAARLDLPLDALPLDNTTALGSMNDEIRRIYPELDDSSDPTAHTPLSIGGVNYSFSDAAPSGAGVVPVWNFHHAELEGMKDADDITFSDDDEVSPRLSMVAERHFMNRSVLSDSPRSVTTPGSARSNGSDGTMSESGSGAGSVSANVTSPKKRSATVSCQTIVTGEILATQLFHEDI